MKQSTKKLEVRVDPDLLEALRKQARAMGYGSLPAYVRAWAVSEVKRPSETNEILDHASVLALRYIELLLAARSPQAHSTDAALDYIRRQLAARSWRAHMLKLGFRNRS